MTHSVRKCHSHWHVGDSGPYGTEGEAQRVADLLNAGVDWDVIYPRPASSRRTAEIDALLHTLGEVWRKYPMLRLGQLIVNVLPPRFNNDAFYIPDDDLTLPTVKSLATPSIRPSALDAVVFCSVTTSLPMSTDKPSRIVPGAVHNC